MAGLPPIASLLGRRPRQPKPVGGEGPRGYVGGLWHELGELQFRFMVDHGLQPQHVLLDVACGALRGGVRFVPYLDAGNYLGLDIAPDLIEHGKTHELGPVLTALKQPEFVISASFEFERFSKRPDFAIAQSLFTHLVPADIALCLRNLRQVASRHTIFFATFFEGSSSENAASSHPHAAFRYSRQEFAALASETGWSLTYLGSWNHPRQQMMLQFTPAGT